MPSSVFEEFREYQLVARHQWFMPVILATKEAEIRRMAVQSQTREDLISKNTQ
jgi:hypothetical protein